jgi:hypothetical protein
MLNRTPNAAPSPIVGCQGLPLALVEAAEVASRHSGIIVPFELVSLARRGGGWSLHRRLSPSRDQAPH